MRNLGLVCCVLFVLAACAAGQKMELTGAYSHLTGPVGKDGFDLSAAYLFAKHLGLEGDVGGYYANLKSGNDNVYSYAGGPTVMLAKRYQAVTPFIHLLFGGAHEFGTNYFAVLGGGGVDIGSKKVALRFKLDAVNFNKDTHARVGLGLMVRP